MTSLMKTIKPEPTTKKKHYQERNNPQASILLIFKGRFIIENAKNDCYRRIFIWDLSHFYKFQSRIFLDMTWLFTYQPNTRSSPFKSSQLSIIISFEYPDLILFALVLRVMFQFEKELVIQLDVFSQIEKFQMNHLRLESQKPHFQI